MNGKISFGVDFLHAMLETDARSQEKSINTLLFARALLVLEWGLSTQEQEEATKLFFEKINEKTLEDFPDVATRLTNHIKNSPEAKAKFLTDIILIASLDGDLSPKEKEFIKVLGDTLDFRLSEVGELAERADDMFDAFVWFAKNYSLNKEK